MHAKYFFFIIVTITFFSYGIDSDRSPTSQLERGPAVVAQKGLLQFEQISDLLKGNGITDFSWRLEISYGISEKLGFRAIIPSILKLKDEELNTKSFGDIFILFDWYFFRTKEVIASFISGLKLPTASKQITAIFSSQSLDLPLEFQMIYNVENWYAESDFFALIKLKARKKIKFGDVYTFAYALGPKYNFLNPRYFETFYLVGRMSGLHVRSRFVEGVPDDNSGGTLFLLGPDITLANNHLVLRGLFQLPILNRPFGVQNVADFRALFSIKVLF